jgi:hypothetical protein
MGRLRIANKKLLLFRIAAACIGLFGLIYRLILDPLFVEGPNNRLFQLGFFSVQSFIYITIIFIMLVINQVLDRKDAWPTPAFRGAALLYGIISATLFGAFFAGTFQTRGLSLIVLYSNHVLMPVLIMIDNIVSIPAKSYKFDLLIFWMIYPLYYLIFTIYESYALNVSRYYFLELNNSNATFYPYMLFLMAVMFVVCGALIIFINKIYKSRPKNHEAI